MNPPAVLPEAPAASPRGPGRPRAELAHLTAIEHPFPAFRAALDDVRPSLHDLAAVLEVAPRTLSAYYSADRGIPERVRRRMASYLRAHAARLERLAVAIEAEGLHP